MRKMSPERIYAISGYLSLIFGAAAALSIYKMPLLYLGIPVAILGMLLAVYNIFLQTKHGFDQGKFAKGYLGLLLSSLPILFLAVMIFLAKPN